MTQTSIDAALEAARPTRETAAHPEEWREALRICQAAFRTRMERGFPVEVAEIIRRGRQERTERILRVLP